VYGTGRNQEMADVMMSDFFYAVIPHYFYLSFFQPVNQSTNQLINYSVLNDFAGFAMAALMDWKLVVQTAISKASKPAMANIHQLIAMR